MRSLRGADGLRAIACLMVIFHHFAQKIMFNAVDPTVRAIGQFFITGQSGVSVFFILSGFLLAMPFWEAYISQGKLPDLRVYAIRRAGRIMPGFFLNLFICFFIGLIFIPDAPSLIWRYLAGLSFTASFHWLSFFPAEINGPLWSIGFEVVSYVLMPIGMIGLFALLGKKRSITKGLLWWVVVWLIVFGANQLIQDLVKIDSHGRGWQYGMVGGAKFWMPRYNPIGFFGHYCLGVIAAGLSLWWGISPKADLRRRWFDLASLISFGLWLGLLISRAGQDDFSFNLQGQPYYFPAFPAITGLLLACLTQSSLMGKLFDNPFFRFTARISFGLYLWHYLIMWLIQVTIAPDYVYGRISDLGRWSLLCGVVLVISYAIATLSWYLFEKPILAKAQAWKPRLPGQARQWTGFKSFVAISLAILIIVPPVAASFIRPASWDFPWPYFIKRAAVTIPQGKGTIQVTITGAHSTKGSLLVSVYKGGFDESNVVARTAVPAAPKVTVEFNDIAYGECAVLGMHDENDDKAMQMNGNMPAEGVIQVISPTGPPIFEALKFNFEQPKLEIDTKVYYMQ